MTAGETHRDSGATSASRGAILTADQQRTLDEWRSAGQRVVFTNGVFDLLHRGHVEYLAESRALGDRLVVGLNSDASVRRLGKGDDRPLVGEEDRAAVLAALACVDLVVRFDEDTPERLIREVRPDVLAKGGDWSLEAIAGREFVESHGGRVVRLALREGHGTTRLVERIRDRSGANVRQAVPFFFVADMEASRRFYMEGLGFRQRYHWIDEGKVSWCWLEHGDAALMLQEWRKERVPESKMGVGVSICFVCRDAIALYREWTGRGIGVRRPFVGNHLWVTSVSDPDGYQLDFESPTDAPEGSEYSGD